MPDDEKTKAPKVDDAGRRATSGGSPMVFISHDNRDARLAEAFSKLLSSVSAGVLKSFRSSDRKGTQGIEYGVEWFPELMSKLDSASDVVCLLTKRSLDRPWILYEAGVAKGKLETPVYGVALGIPLGKANAGPFAQFQNSDDEEESLTKLVMQLLRRIPDSEPDQEAVRMQVRSFKDKASAVLKDLKDPKNPQEADPLLDASSVAKLFEEVKVMFQDLPSRVEGRLLEGVTPVRRRRLTHVHPLMLQEMAHMVSDDPSDPIGLLFIAGVLRDDVPWLAELITESYRQIRAGDAKAAQHLRSTLKNLRRGPFMEEFLPESKEMHMFMMELPMMLDHYVAGIESQAQTRSSRKKPGKAHNASS